MHLPGEPPEPGVEVDLPEEIPPSRRAERTLSAAVQALVPADPRHLRALFALCAHPHSDAAEFTDVILRDFGLTLQLLRRGNAAFFGRGRQRVIRMRHIVVLLGIDNISRAISPLPLLPEGDRAADGEAGPLLRLLARSVFEATLARSLTPTGLEAQEVTACAMLKRLGQVLLSVVQPGVGRTLWALRAKPGLLDRTAKRMTGWRPGELGLAAARRWNFPGIIRLSIAPARQRLRAGRGRDRRLVTLVDEVHAWVDGAAVKETSRRYLEEIQEDLFKLTGFSPKRFERLVARSVFDFEKGNPGFFRLLRDEGVFDRLVG
ncbi:HDOD domain-containing protein [Dissulfurirhabdus thermomarina]|uniref:HDOD domain-containing protein n=1 Tax=Dissulfurirhabdus thermomarina TaxID=1765737 RepID=A0A6N9TNC0_DISTH|nr:HDOD domain-containing protein [Dissulfurirhabdus thermomarina]NDY41573.1 HDOD domain-containing protein [Dissulfurirhabdus thermomarina]NMX22372.1 HDOD domain-containing protein [Dissulfurirhabdus thermomarina]